MKEKEYAISEELANAIIRYLLSRPMIEVENLVNALRQMPAIERTEK